MAKPVCLVTGVGPGTGLAVARRFAAGGYAVAMVARSAETLARFAEAVPGTYAVPADVTDPGAVTAAVARVRSDLGAPSVLVHNAGNAVFGSVLEVQEADFERAWRVNTYALFLLARAVVPDMVAAGRGTILVTGATASRRGGAGFAAFASAKAAQRVLAESMARSLGPRGVHVAYVVVDGVIDVPATRAFFADKPDDFFLRPDAIADTFFHLAGQDRSAWSFEVDVRPFGEKW
ncbi:MAG TPA: SDR family NAD(P)-dependent oxidoreductase [Candidatus Limnocylindria bacterium]|nr:SDR family NAD(P)-dependent oxidoreductase [Candidatus Limnocylindria bacterium]